MLAAIFHPENLYDSALFATDDLKNFRSHRILADLLCRTERWKESRLQVSTMAKAHLETVRLVYSYEHHTLSSPWKYYLIVSCCWKREFAIENYFDFPFFVTGVSLAVWSVGGKASHPFYGKSQNISIYFSNPLCLFTSGALVPGAAVWTCVSQFTEHRVVFQWS